MAEVAHIWAHRLQDAAKSGNVFMDGDSIYSYGYHFEIARWVLPLNGSERIAMYNTQSRSASTAKHQAAVRMAMDKYTVVLRVPKQDYMFSTCECTDGSVRLGGTGFDCLAHLFMYDAGRILDYAHKQKRARTTDYRAWIAAAINNMRIAFSSFGLYKQQTLSFLGGKKVTVPPLLDYMNEEKPKYDAWIHDSVFSELYDVEGRFGFVGRCREEMMRMSVRRNVWVVNEMRDLGVFEYSEKSGFSVDLTHDLLTELIERLLSAEGEVVEGMKSKLQQLEKKNVNEKRRLEELAMKEKAERIARWREGSYTSGLWDIPYVLLRLVERGGVKIVETSKGVRLTIEECRRLWAFWKAIVKKGVEFRHELALDANGHRWVVNSVDDHGTLRAGCHTIEFSEGLEMAKKLNFDID